VNLSDTGSHIGASLKLKSSSRQYDSLVDRSFQNSPRATAENKYAELPVNKPFYQGTSSPIYQASANPFLNQPYQSNNPFESSPVFSNEQNYNLSSHRTVRQDPYNPLMTAFVKSGNQSAFNSPKL
jgi:hypothetical protein